MLHGCVYTKDNVSEVRKKCDYSIRMLVQVQFYLIINKFGTYFNFNVQFFMLCIFLDLLLQSIFHHHSFSQLSWWWFDRFWHNKLRRARATKTRLSAIYSIYSYCTISQTIRQQRCFAFVVIVITTIAML